MNNKEFQGALNLFAEHLKSKMGENKATHFMNSFMQIPSGDKLKNLIETLILYTCQEYGIPRETFFHSTKMIHFYARITCYHILKTHLHIPVTRMTDYFIKKKTDSITDGIDKAQAMLDVPQYNPDFVDKYKSLEKQYITYSDSIHERK